MSDYEGSKKVEYRVPVLSKGVARSTSQKLSGLYEQVKTAELCGIDCLKYNEHLVISINELVDKGHDQIAEFIGTNQGSRLYQLGMLEMIASLRKQAEKNDICIPKVNWGLITEVTDRANKVINQRNEESAEGNPDFDRAKAYVSQIVKTLETRNPLLLKIIRKYDPEIVKTFEPQSEALPMILLSKILYEAADQEFDIGLSEKSGGRKE